MINVLSLNFIVFPHVLKNYYVAEKERKPTHQSVHLRITLIKSEKYFRSSLIQSLSNFLRGET